MISKEAFINIMTRFIKQRNEREKYIEKVEELLPNAWEPIVNYGFQDLFIDALTEACEDDNEWLAYFVYEGDCQFPYSYYEGGMEYKINNLDELYALIDTTI